MPSGVTGNTPRSGRGDLKVRTLPRQLMGKQQRKLRLQRAEMARRERKKLARQRLELTRCIRCHAIDAPEFWPMHSVPLTWGFVWESMRINEGEKGPSTEIRVAFSSYGSTSIYRDSFLRELKFKR